MKKYNIIILVCFIALANIAYAGTFYATVAGAGTNSGADWANAFADSDLETYLEASAAAGDIFYVSGSGTYDYSAGDIDVRTLDGTAALPIWIIGVVGESTTEATGTDRPTFNFGTGFGFLVGDYYIVKNIIISGSDPFLFEGTLATYIINCKSTNSYGSANGYAIRVGNGGLVKSCEAISTLGYAIGINGNNARVLYSYAHDSNYGIYVNGAAPIILFNIIDDSTTDGIALVSNDYGTIINNTIRSSGGVGISATDSVVNYTGNNIIDSNATGASWSTAEYKSNYFDYNNWDNTTEVSNVTRGPNMTEMVITFGGADNSSISGNGVDDGETISIGIQ